MSIKDTSGSAGRRSGAPRAVGVHFAGDLRQALLDAAVAALDEAGADRLSLRDVARRAGVSHAAPAHHFTDKAGLLTAVATEGFGMLVTYLADAQPGAARQPADQLAALGRAYAQFAEENPGRFEVMFRPGLLHAGDAAADDDVRGDALVPYRAPDNQAPDVERRVGQQPPEPLEPAPQVCLAG